MYCNARKNATENVQVVGPLSPIPLRASHRRIVRPYGAAMIFSSSLQTGSEISGMKGCETARPPCTSLRNFLARPCVKRRKAQSHRARHRKEIVRGIRSVGVSDSRNGFGPAFMREGNSGVQFYALTWVRQSWA
jgi:hypothetical protein